MIQIKDLKLNDANPRYIRDERFGKLKQSIEQFPKMMNLRPIVVDGNGVVLGGNMRLRALIDLGYKSIPGEWVKKASELTEEEKRRFIIADNTGFGEWDWDLLANEWDSVELETWGMEVPTEWTGEQGENSELGWNPPKTEEAELGDGINELVGYGLQSFWKDIRNENSELYPHWIELPVQEKTNLVRQKYSRTNLEEIRRVIKTYMREGDFFLENCCGWSTFGCSAALQGFSGVGVDIWDVAIKHSNKQYDNLKKNGLFLGEYKAIEGDGMALTFNNNSFDFVYCNPPFMDQEKYSGLDNDISSSNPDVFAQNFIKLMSENFRVLKPGNLCVITINDMRKKSFLIPLQAQVIQWGEMAGFKLWDFVVAEVLSQKIRLRKKDYEKRRTVKCHEYVIVFKK